jgi:DNA (cytosine-5)-methyltransferase 1
MKKPKLLDLFCGAGGAGMGYHRAGFDVVGVDLQPQPRYPFEFYQADAMTFDLAGFDAIHASPPCQHYMRGQGSALRKAGRIYPDLLPATRERLRVSGAPWVIENVPGAPMRADVVLCGSLFGLPIVRHRLFEFWQAPNALILLPACSHARLAITVTGLGTPSYVRNSRKKAGIAMNYQPGEVAAAMGMPWAIRRELSQAIPPAYTQWIGERLLAAMAVA